jgi:RNA polymerase sigma-70 factor (ECF subfamily)
MHVPDFRKDILPLRDKLFRLALRITLNRAEAEDVVQETMIRVWNGRAAWHEIDSIEAYCFTIARNLAIDRSERKDAQTASLTDETAQIADPLTPHRQLELQEQLDIIHRLINALPEKQRTVMQLRDIEGMSYREIAERMNISEEQVKVNLFRARKKVKEHYLDNENYGNRKH